jgi:uncharacterized protein YkwD
MRRFLPRILSTAVLALALAGCAMTPTARGPVTINKNDASAAAQSISTYRAQRGLSAVQVDWALMGAAEEQARAIAAMDGLSHDAAGPFVRRMKRYGINGAAAENLGAGAQNAGRALERWQASPSHNENLLMPEARRIGLVAAHAPETRYKHFWVLVLAD